MLRNDRINAGFSQKALVAACSISFHIGTLRRAERGENISRVYLESIANALNDKAEKYDNSPLSEAPSTYICNGDWTSFFVRNHTGSKPYIVEEYIKLVHNETELSGYTVSTYRHTDYTRGFYHAGVTGESVVLSRSNEWADGTTSWFDMDWQSIRQSRHIMVRNSSQLFDSYIKDVKSHMEKEILLYQSRYGSN